MPADFVDLERRKTKAKAIATRLRCDGITPEVAVALARDTKWMRATERAAGVGRSSDATWALAMQDLARRPPVLEHDRRTGCSCEPDPDTGALYEFEGWPCPHGSDDLPGPIDPAIAAVITDGPTPANVALVEALVDASVTVDPLLDSIAAYADAPLASAGEPVVLDLPADDSWADL